MRSQWIHSLPSCIWKIVLPTVPIESQWCCLSSEMDLHGAEPQFKDGSVYRQNRPSKLDKIRNLRVEVDSSGVIGRTLRLTRRMNSQAPADEAGAFPLRESTDGWDCRGIA